MPDADLLALIARQRTIKGAAAYLGVSSSFLVENLRSRTDYSRPTIEIEWTEQACREIFKKYRSVRFVARMLGVSEGHVRTEVAALGLDIYKLIDYTVGDNSNAKGRRAELDYADQRKEAILEDMNVTQGSQAKWDFTDAEYGKVNVKSSVCHKYKARTRKDNPFYWKFSTRGKDNADYFAVMLYDEAGERLIDWIMIHTTNVTKRSEVVQIEDGKPVLK